MFVANSMAAQDFAADHPEVPVFGTTNNANISYYHALFSGQRNIPASRIKPLREAGQIPAKAREGNQGVRAYVIVDGETMGWGRHHKRLKQIPDCWRKERKLEPAVGSAGGWMMRGLRAIVAGAGGVIPGISVDGITARMGRYIEPRLARVYAVSDGCDFSL